jgi:ABC-type uncharacterized transport system YnjBCD ATPase subunit
LWELADAHIPFVDLNAAPVPEPAVMNALVEGDGIAALIGPSGSGKSSVLASVAKQLATAESRAGRRYLPVFLPVAGRPEHASRLDIFGQGVMLEVILALRSGLDGHYRERLERAMAEQVTTHSSGAKFLTKLAASIPGLTGEVGFELAQDLVSVVGRQSWTTTAA